MPRIAYVDKRFRSSSIDLINAANLIIAEYIEKGFTLTLRQLYYQFVARGWSKNTQRSYDRLGRVINDARLAGYIDWDHLVDRTRSLAQLSQWHNPQHLLRSAASSYHIDWWEDQERRPEVWIEKDALAGVIAPVCERYDVAYFSCRGYTSQSEMWAAAQRHLDYYRCGQTPVVIHLGDHDPSGVDMTRDILDRLTLFIDDSVEVDRIALNMDQVEEFNPPPNPAKITDSRAGRYIEEFGYSSWELDALNPDTLDRLISTAIEGCIDDETAFDLRKDQEESERKQLTEVASRWNGVTQYLETAQEESEE